MAIPRVEGVGSGGESDGFEKTHKADWENKGERPEVAVTTNQGEGHRAAMKANLQEQRRDRLSPFGGTRTTLFTILYVLYGNAEARKDSTLFSRDGGVASVSKGEF